MGLNKQELTLKIKEKAIELGFDDCGVAKAEYLKEPSERLKNWLKNGYHAEMKYMENHFEKRVDPRLLVENAKSIICVILNYYPEKVQNRQSYQLSKYAYGEDYHFVLKRKLKSLFSYIQEIKPETEGRAFVDSAPVMDREWAQKAGLGWIGKHSLLINKKIGSFIFLGELIVNFELEYDTPINEYCGTCTRCIDSCPTNAIVSSKVVDSNKCISYQTIENKSDTIPKTLKGKFNGYIFGCDICQDVCPWNNKKLSTKETSFSPFPEMLQFTKNEWQDLEKEKFNAIFKKSAVKRSGFKGLKRNINFNI